MTVRRENKKLKISHKENWRAIGKKDKNVQRANFQHSGMMSQLMFGTSAECSVDLV